MKRRDLESHNLVFKTLASYEAHLVGQMIQFL